MAPEVGGTSEEDHEMPTLTSLATATSRLLLALLLAGATTVATAQDRPRGGGRPPADHPQT